MREVACSNEIEEVSEVDEKRIQQNERKAAQGRKYRHENKEQLALRRKEYYRKNKERILAKQREYYRAHKQELSQYAKEYYKANKEQIFKKNQETHKIRLQEYRREYQNKNRLQIYRKKINDYCYRSIERNRQLCPDRIDRYLICFPFEKYAEQYINTMLSKHKIPKSADCYADCSSAGMLAYLYSIHQCAANQYDHVIPYIRKMIRIYIVCALVLYNDTKNLCQENNFRVVYLDSNSNYLEV